MSLSKGARYSHDEKLTRHGEAAVWLTNNGYVRKVCGEVEHVFCLMRRIVILRVAKYTIDPGGYPDLPTWLVSKDPV
jgi:hypothetical protein